MLLTIRSRGNCVASCTRGMRDGERALGVPGLNKDGLSCHFFVLESDLIAVRHSAPGTHLRTLYVSCFFFLAKYIPVFVCLFFETDLLSVAPTVLELTL